jgi:predicted Zn-dependent protease
MRKSSSSKSSNGRDKSVKGSRKTSSSTPSRKASNGKKTRTNASVARKKRVSNTKWIDFLKANPALNRLFAEGIRLKRAGKPEEAAKRLEKAVSEFPDVVPLLGYLGGVYLHDLDQPAQSLPIYQRATQLRPKSKPASLGVFHSLWDLGRVDEALAEIKRYQTLTDWGCQDYVDIIAEMNEKGSDETPPKSLRSRRSSATCRATPKRSRKSVNGRPRTGRLVDPSLP